MNEENSMLVKPEAPVNSPKMRAYLRMQELRKETVAYEVSDGQRAQALDEKFGTIG